MSAFFTVLHLLFRQSTQSQRYHSTSLLFFVCIVNTIINRNKRNNVLYLQSFQCLFIICHFWKHELVLTQLICTNHCLVPFSKSTVWTFTMLWEIFVIMVLFGLVFLSFLPLVNRTNDAGENFFKVPYCLVVFVLVAGLGASHHLGSKHLAWFDAENFEKFETSKIRVGKCSSTLVRLILFSFWFTTLTTLFSDLCFSWFLLLNNL